MFRLSERITIVESAVRSSYEGYLIAVEALKKACHLDTARALMAEIWSSLDHKTYSKRDRFNNDHITRELGIFSKETSDMISIYSSVTVEEGKSVDPYIVLFVRSKKKDFIDKIRSITEDFLKEDSSRVELKFVPYHVNY